MKIDKSFIFDFQGKTGARDLVESAVGMAKRMGIKVVAEGVESESVFQELRRMGCDEVQGYLVGKAMPADAIVPFFTDWKTLRRGDPSGKRLPKVAIVQALLNELAGDLTATAPAGPYSKHALPVIAAESSRALVRQIPPLVLEGKTIQALGLCHEAIDALQKICPENALSAKLLHLQAQLEEDIAATADIEIASRQGRFRPLAKDAVTLGRPSSQAEVDIPIKCRWFGMGDKNLRIFHQGGQYFIEDLGSTQGHLINGARLVRRRPLELAYGRTVVEICLASGAIAPLCLLLNLNSSDPNALAVSFDYDARALRADLGEKEWSGLKDQLGCSWIIFQDTFNIGRSSECALALPDCAAPLAATIAFEKGYWIAPAAGVSLKVQNTVIRRRLPILLDSEMEIAGSLLSIRGTAPG